MNQGHTGNPQIGQLMRDESGFHAVADGQNRQVLLVPFDKFMNPFLKFVQVVGLDIETDNDRMSLKILGQVPAALENRLTLDITMRCKVVQQIENDFGRSGTCRFVRYENHAVLARLGFGCLAAA